MTLPDNFDVVKVPLADKNLIEASAGTGKTYSVAIMVLRLILENDIHINQILMVTFTKAAVAELEERIRRFVRFAHRYADGENIDDPSIKAIVDAVAQEKGMEYVQQKLNSAVINLDETAVLTIHSFCQQTLTEFAFETNQLFNVEMLSDLNPVLEEAAQKFWRENITGMHSNLLSLMLDRGLSIPSIMNVVKNHLDGKLFYGFDKSQTYSLDKNKQTELSDSIVNAKAEVESHRHSIAEAITRDLDELRSKCDGNRYAKKAFSPLLYEANAVINLIIEKRDTGYVKDIFEPYLENINRIVSSEEIYTDRCNTCLNYVYNFAIQEISKLVDRKKVQLNQMTFDDVITKLYFALNHDNPNPAKQKLQQDLIRQMQWKYKAVFIDEFQDTDNLQYQIFKKAFGTNTILFFIGDPKQSIYAWRKADIETYFEARRNVDHQYSMQTNFRSSKNLVTALNHFFLPYERFDTFYYNAEGNVESSAITYIPVTTPKQSKKGEMEYAGEPVVPVSIYKDSNKANLGKEMVKQISDLLNNPEYSIQGRRIKPSDIGILVRSNKHAFEIKSALSRVNIPAVTVTDTKVLQSLEAQELVYVLDAILNHTRAKVNRVLTTSFINWTPDEILRLDEDVIIERFRNYLLKWQEAGIYAALTDFIHGFQIQRYLLSSHTENGERIITNFYHLMEVLYRTENRQHFGPAELLDWLKINRNKPESSDDEMVQRIESDEEAIRIVTIHRSKGLEYNIVIAPSLDFVIRSQKEDKDKIIGVRNESGNYISLKREEADAQMEQLYQKQSEQENRRLLYVALTRAVYKCFIYNNTWHYYKNSTLKTFLDAINLEETQGLIEEIPALETTPKAYRPEKENKQFPLEARNFQLAHRNWTQTSYSGLAAHPEYIKRENYTLKEDDYDDFVFRELTKGAKTGTFIHHIFENIDFSDAGKWEFAIERAIGRFVPDKKEVYPEKIEAFLKQVLQTKIDTDTQQFKIADISHSELLHEMEFDFPMELFPIKTLEKLIENGITVKNPEEFPQQIEGIMTGFVDLFFRHNGKYYVLDWKTNYLGPKLEDYSPKAVTQAMSDNNYHLQYLIYSYAVKLYLEHRLGDSFDYERDFGGAIYLFVRGMRNGQNTGIYFSKPSVEQMGMMKETFGGNEEMT